jgi:hypothetical protein
MHGNVSDKYGTFVTAANDNGTWRQQVGILKFTVYAVLHMSKLDSHFCTERLKGYFYALCKFDVLHLLPCTHEDDIRTVQTYSQGCTKFPKKTYQLSQNFITQTTDMKTVPFWGPHKYYDPPYKFVDQGHLQSGFYV